MTTIPGYADTQLPLALSAGYKAAMDRDAVTERRPVVLSLGGGLDSFAMLVEAIRRSEIRKVGLDAAAVGHAEADRLLAEGCELPDIVVFMDTGHPDDPGEWPGTYRHIDEVVKPLCAKHGIEFVRIDHTNYPVRDARSLFAWWEARRSMPMAGPGRQCTTIAKVERFEKWLSDRFPGRDVEVWIGFEAGEEKRAAKDPNAGTRRAARKPKAGRPTPARRRNRFPLIEWGLCRCRCEALVREAGFPVPRKSACVFCPFGSRGDWQRFAVELPELFARVVKMEADRPLTKKGIKLSIMGFSSRTKRGPSLPVFVSKPYTAKNEPCTVCGAAVRASKATGCDYLDDNAGAAS